MQDVYTLSLLQIRELPSALSAHPSRPRPFSHPLLSPFLLLVMLLRVRQTVVHRRASPQDRCVKICTYKSVKIYMKSCISTEEICSPTLSPLLRQFLLSLMTRHERWLVLRLPPTVTTHVHPAVRLFSRFLCNVRLLCRLSLCPAAQLFVHRMTSPPLLLLHSLSVLTVTPPQQLNLYPQ